MMNPQASSTKPDLETLGNLPGLEGVIWRLVGKWNVDHIRDWMQEEAVRGTSIEEMQIALGNVLATAVFAFSVNVDKDVGGVVGPFAHALKAKEDRREGKGPRIILPGQLQ